MLAVVLRTSSAAAQRGTASLIPVDSGGVDSTGTERPVDREMCLRGSAYVLAFDRGEGDGEGYATVKYATVGLESFTNGTKDLLLNPGRNIKVKRDVKP